MHQDINRCSGHLSYMYAYVHKEKKERQKNSRVLQQKVVQVEGCYLSERTAVELYDTPLATLTVV